MNYSGLKYISTLIMIVRVLSAAEYYVAPYGSEQNPGTIDAPLQTLSHAVSLMANGDQCYLREGVYHEEVVLDDLSDITIASYSGENVRMDGTISIDSSWIQHSGSIYKTTLAEPVWQLFVNDEMMISARWPNATFENLWLTDEIWAWGNAQDDNGLQYDLPHDGESLSNLNFSLEDGGIAILNVGNWKTWARPVLNHTPGSDNFGYEPVPGYKTKWQNHHYFLEGKLELLDSPGEWFYNPETQELYLWLPGGGNPSNQSVHGKIQDYAITISNSNNVSIRGLDFFATTLTLNGSEDVLIEDCDFNFPSYSKRMIGDLSDTEITLLWGSDREGWAGNILRNCSFQYTEGPALDIRGVRNQIDNCLFHHIDYTSVVFGGNAKSIRSYNGHGTILRRNTFYISGNTSCYRGTASTSEYPSIIEYNNIYRVGLMGSDGASIQMGTGAENSIIRYNWTHDHRKYGYRSDGKWEHGDYGVQGVNHHNMAWNLNNCGFRIKGDEHQTYHNTAFDTDHPGIVIRGIGGGNQNSITRNNAANIICGAKGDASSPIAGAHSHNWQGAIKDQLRDPDNLDFRPRYDSPLVNAGILIPGINDDFVGSGPDIGAYEYGDNNYWIPGRIEVRASTPIPPVDAVEVKTDADLMWLTGRDATSFRIWFGTTADNMIEVATQQHNIYEPGELVDGQTYYWRIDCNTPAGLIEGEQWEFTVGTPATGLQDQPAQPYRFELKGNYPNPFNPTTSIEYTIGEPGEVNLQLFNIQGRFIKSLVDKELEPGVYSTEINGAGLASGVYLISLSTNRQKDVTKCVLIK
ncbi:MAG: T9SS type A sorting domain-containing protein [FCB group bacterium]|nr:T9SS type A sorting domain-containing protein [FCB group bacterium]MBL7120391.1 T9SS type A sorting domain-containing protein [Candidatus Neomarinimicrobiota bacterium]